MSPIRQKELEAPTIRAAALSVVLALLAARREPAIITSDVAGSQVVRVVARSPDRGTLPTEGLLLDDTVSQPAQACRRDKAVLKLAP